MVEGLVLMGLHLAERGLNWVVRWETLLDGG